MYPESPMTDNVTLRTGKDRLRYSLIFEGTLMMMLIPAGAMFFDKPAADIGLLSIILAIKALVVSLVFNWVFDRIDAQHGRVSSERSTAGRILHAVGFEMTLVATSMPFFMWLLDLTLLEALATDLVIMTFVVIYTYFYTLAYDRMFPVHKAQVPAAS
jgi:uncharacterized membrane protein